jgi:hypothetical protein
LNSTLVTTCSHCEIDISNPLTIEIWHSICRKWTLQKLPTFRIQPFEDYEILERRGYIVSVETDKGIYYKPICPQEKGSQIIFCIHPEQHLDSKEKLKNCDEVKAEK